MKKKIVQSDLSLDAVTNRKLEQRAGKWGVSKSEMLRRLIDSANCTPQLLLGFEALQRSLSLSHRQAAQWQKEVRAERRASSDRHLRQP
jgi:hypothetical protein